MVLYNADGSRAEMSGNGIRCFAQALAARRGDLDAADDPHRRRRRDASSCRPTEDPRTILGHASTWARSPSSTEPAGWAAIGADPRPPGRPPQPRQPAHRRRRRRRRRRRPARARRARCPHVNLEIIEPGPEPRRHHDARPRARRRHHRGLRHRRRAPRRGPPPAGASSTPAPTEIVVHMDGGSARVALHRPDARPRHADRPGHLRRHDRDPARHVSNPYNEALGATLIERAVRERIVLVGVTFPGSDDEDTEASLDELAALIDTAGADEVGRAGAAPRPPRPHVVHRQGQGRGAARAVPRRRRRHGRVRQRADARPSSTTWRSCSGAPPSTAPR